MEKLVRDRIMEFSQAAGDGREFRYARPEELAAFYAKKIVEEAQEVAQELLANPNDPTLLMAELGDLTQVMEQIIEHRSIQLDTLAQMKAHKAEQKGAFKDGLILNLSTDIPRKVL